MTRPERSNDHGDVVEGVAQIGDDLAQPEREVAWAADHLQIGHLGFGFGHAMGAICYILPVPGEMTHLRRAGATWGARNGAS